MTLRAFDSSAFFRRIDAAIAGHGMLRKGDVVLAGISGGPDSVCMLRVLHALRGQREYSLHAVYVDHNLRPAEVLVEIEFCTDLCGELGIPFQVRRIDVAGHAKARRMNRQEAARELRYREFEACADALGATRIALAHTLDDQAETLLMRLVRGAGPSGLSGIPPVRGRIIRPLIGTEREEIESFLAAGGCRSLLDSSNLSRDYLRNHVRLALMPELKRLNPRFLQAAGRTARIFREEERYFDVVVTKALMRMISRKTDTRIELFLAPLEALEPVVLRRVLRRAVDAVRGIRGIGFDQIEEIAGLIRHGASGDRLTLPKSVRVIREYSLLVITTDPPAKIERYGLDPPCEVVVKGSGMVLRAAFCDEADETADGRTSVVLDAEKLVFPLLVRPREAGDFFHPLGFGKRKKLQDFFVDAKVPRDERDAVPLVVSGDDIVWIAGHRADERFRATPGTKKFLRLGIVKGKK
ncbi:MAG: tRNA lysidine(34) synthetase TilS [Thermodesulfovibrionales bacterium]